MRVHLHLHPRLVAAIDAAADAACSNRTAMIRTALAERFLPGVRVPPLVSAGAPQATAAPVLEPDPAPPPQDAPPPPLRPARSKAEPGVIAADWGKLKAELDDEMPNVREIRLDEVFSNARVAIYPAALRRARQYVLETGRLEQDGAYVRPPPPPPPLTADDRRKVREWLRPDSDSLHVPRYLARDALRRTDDAAIEMVTEELRAAGWTPRDDGRWAAP